MDNRIELIKGITCHDENNFQIFNCILPCDNEKFHSNPAICSYRTLRDVFVLYRQSFKKLNFIHFTTIEKQLSSTTYIN